MARPSSFNSRSRRSTHFAPAYLWLATLTALAAFAFYAFSSNGFLHVSPPESPVAESSALQIDGAAISATAPAELPGAAEAAQRWAEKGIVLVFQNQEWDALSLANIDGALSLLPDAIFSQLGNPELGPVRILVNSKGASQSGNQPYGGPANYFSTNEGRNELVLFPGQPVETVLHELGHAYNLRHTPAGRYALVVNDPEMRGFLDATGWTLTAPAGALTGTADHMALDFRYTGAFTWPELSHFDPLEDYANSFAAFFADPASFAVAAPDRYTYLAATLPR